MRRPASRRKSATAPRAHRPPAAPDARHAQAGRHRRPIGRARRVLADTHPIPPGDVVPTTREFARRSPHSIAVELREQLLVCRPVMHGVKSSCPSWFQVVGRYEALTSHAILANEFSVFISLHI